MDEITEEEPSDVLTPDTNNATYFQPSENNKRPDHYKRLRLYNRGTWYDRREEVKKVTHRADNLAIFDAIAGQLDLAKNTKKEARRVFDGLDFQQLGRSVSLLAFAVCAVVANEYCPQGKRHWPTSTNVDERFLEVGADLGLSENKQLSLMYIVDGARN